MSTYPITNVVALMSAVDFLSTCMEDLGVPSDAISIPYRRDGVVVVSTLFAGRKGQLTFDLQADGALHLGYSPRIDLSDEVAEYHVVVPSGHASVSSLHTHLRAIIAGQQVAVNG